VDSGTNDPPPLRLQSPITTLQFSPWAISGTT